MPRLELNDTQLDAFVKMAEGNPGALTALMDVFHKAGVIDPQAAFGGFGVLLSLDTHEIYGSSIYILWSDKCGRDARSFVLLLRAVQLGFMPERRLQQLAADQWREIELSQDEWQELDEKVCAELEQFQRVAPEAPAQAIA